jgi:hypothetical protein
MVAHLSAFWNGRIFSRTRAASPLSPTLMEIANIYTFLSLTHVELLSIWRHDARNCVFPCSEQMMMTYPGTTRVGHVKYLSKPVPPVLATKRWSDVALKTREKDWERCTLFDIAHTRCPFVTVGTYARRKRCHSFSSRKRKAYHPS